jgi:hypothetical protein
MRLPDWLRLGMVSLLLVLAQQALLLARPEWRLGFDLYVPWLLAIAALRGPSTGIVLAVGGGLFMDAASSLHCLHILYYLVPVGIGALFSAHMVAEYRLLAALTTGGLVMLKLLVCWGIALLAGWLPGADYLLRVRYSPLLALCGLVVLSWPRLVALALPPKAAAYGR